MYTRQRWERKDLSWHGRRDRPQLSSEMATPAYRSIYPEERKDRILTYWYKLNFRASGFSSKEFQLKHRLLLEVWIRFLTVMGFCLC